MPKEEQFNGVFVEGLADYQEVYLRGMYNVEITKAQIVETKNGNKRLMVTFSVLEGNEGEIGEQVSEFYPLDGFESMTPRGKRWNLGRLAKLYDVLDIDRGSGTIDPSQLLGLQCRAQFNPRNDQNGVLQNSVNDLAKAEGF